jgi:gluconolactonase
MLFKDVAVVLDERFRRLFNSNARLEKLYEGCRWAEGPAYFPAGRYLIWSDIPNDRMMRYDETSGHVSVFRHPAGYSNGNTVDRQGRLVTCEHGNRRVTRTEFDGSITVIADRYQGKRLNSPNDVVVKSDGSIWFTDPAYGIDSDYEGHKSESEIGACNVYCVDPQSGEVRVVADDFVRPNGIAFSPDERRLTSSTRAPPTRRTAPAICGCSTSGRGQAFRGRGVRHLHRRALRRLPVRHGGADLDQRP